MSLFAGQDALTGAMAPLVTLEDYFEWVGVASPTAEQTNRAQTALEIASGLIRAVTRRELTLNVGDTQTVDAPAKATLVLPEYPVVAIDSLFDGSTSYTPSEYDLSPQTGMLTLRRGVFSGRRGGISVTYTHGYDPLPRDIAGACMTITKRAYDNPGGLDVRQQTIGDVSYTFSTGSAEGGSPGMTSIEAVIVNRYAAEGYA